MKRPRRQHWGKDLAITVALLGAVSWGTWLFARQKLELGASWTDGTHRYEATDGEEIRFAIWDDAEPLPGEVNEEGAESRPAVSPDGRFLVFASGERGLGARDVVLGISASGTTPYVHGALDFARQRGAASVMLACVPFDNVPDTADLSIRVDTGPEVVAGSTRLKAGTATKMVLNSISTLVMVQLGKVHGNRMVDVNTSGNTKLLDRGIRLVSELCDLEREPAAALLERAGGRVKLAVVMHARGVDSVAAEELLAAAGGHLRGALAGSSQP